MSDGGLGCREVDSLLGGMPFYGSNGPLSTVVGVQNHKTQYPTDQVGPQALGVHLHCRVQMAYLEIQVAVMSLVRVHLCHHCVRHAGVPK